jgi:hypothetical protein
MKDTIIIGSGNTDVDFFEGGKHSSLYHNFSPFPAHPSYPSTSKLKALPLKYIPNLPNSLKPLYY